MVLMANVNHDIKRAVNSLQSSAGDACSCGHMLQVTEVSPGSCDTLKERKWL